MYYSLSFTSHIKESLNDLKKKQRGICLYDYHKNYSFILFSYFLFDKNIDFLIFRESLNFTWLKMLPRIIRIFNIEIWYNSWLIKKNPRSLIKHEIYNRCFLFEIYNFIDNRPLPVTSWADPEFFKGKGGPRDYCVCQGREGGGGSSGAYFLYFS